jgi:hypothetical protein
MKKFALLALGLFLAVNMNAWYVPGFATAKKVATSAWNHKKKVIAGAVAAIIATHYTTGCICSTCLHWDSEDKENKNRYLHILDCFRNTNE